MKITKTELQEMVRKCAKQVLREAMQGGGANPRNEIEYAIDEEDEAINIPKLKRKKKRTRPVISVWEFSNILAENGWAYSSYSEVTRRSDGAKGFRYVVDEYHALVDKSVPFDEVFKKIQQASSDPSYVDRGIAQYRYASEIKYNTIIILEK